MTSSCCLSYDVITPELIQNVAMEKPVNNEILARAIVRGANNVSYNNVTQWDLPIEMTFNNINVMSVVVYSVLFVVAASGNMAVFCTLFRNRHRRSRVNLFIMHLALADMIVAFVMLPLEIGWHVTVSWQAGDGLCRLFMFCRAYGLYLSSFILIAISLDRYFTFTSPLTVRKAERRGRIMLMASWVLSFVSSIPQSIIFHTEKHPLYPSFSQCVTFNFFPSARHELAYNLFTVIAVYLLPLTVILFSYSLILGQMSRKAARGKERFMLRRNGPVVRKHTSLPPSRSGSQLERARNRTLKMTIVIVSVFIVCWTPYVVISAWWWFDHVSADEIHPQAQKGLFLFAVSNSCMNPIVYGMFSTVFRRSMNLYWHRLVVRLSCLHRHRQCPRCGLTY